MPGVRGDGVPDRDRRRVRVVRRCRSHVHRVGTRATEVSAMTDDQRPPEQQPGAGDQPEQPQPPEQPAVEQPTTAWTPPEQPTPAWTPPPAGAPPTPAWTPPP